MTTPPSTPKPPAVVWSDVVRRIEAREPIPLRAGETELCPQEPRSWPLRTGPLAVPPAMDVDEDGLPTPLPARPYVDTARRGVFPRTLAAGGQVLPPSSEASDVVPFPVTRLYEQPRPVPPPAAELRAMADDLNAHGGYDERFVAALLEQATDPPVLRHRRSCQHDEPPGPTCPGCTEIDELLAIAHANAAVMPPHTPGRGWLARALRRLFT